MAENKAMAEQKIKRTFYDVVVKRFLDMLLSGLAIIILLPFMLILVLVILIDDPGPVFFTQKRIGIHKKYVKIHKFRSMKMSTPHDVPTHLLKDPDQYITRVGKFLRRFSVDELPQLLDIFVGKMSIVGPRPALWKQDDLVAARDLYHANDVKPGLTGWAQINGRDTLEIEDKARFDGDYTAELLKSNGAGFKMDVKCIFRSIKVVLTHAGEVEGGTGRNK
jgi:O-antigen biosynthesis protein WbqP